MYTSTSRRNVFIRTIASVTGDITVGYAMASACVWVIQTAALGTFLSFLAWIVTILLALAISQYAVHPAVNLLLSDRKLDRGIEALSSLAAMATDLGVGIGSPAWQQLSQGIGRGVGRFTTRFATR